MEHDNTASAKTRSPEEQARIRAYARLIIFVFVLVIIWYGFDLADL